MGRLVRNHQLNEGTPRGPFIITYPYFIESTFKLFAIEGNRIYSLDICVEESPTDLEMLLRVDNA